MTAAMMAGANAGVEDGLKEIRNERAEKVSLYQQVRQARQQRAKIAAADINEFAAFVGKDDETGERMAQEPIHERIQAEAEEHPRLIVMAHPESGKTTQLAILKPLHMLGNNPNLRIAIVSKTQENAKKMTSAMISYMEKSQELAEVFPDLLPGPQWTASAFKVRRGVHSKDPSVQAVGLDGTIIGSRVDVMIFDDILDHENTGTAASRKAVLKRVRSGFLDRLSKGGVVIILTNAWHPEDAAHVLEKEGWPCVRIPVIDEEGTPSWPDKWPEDRIAEARVDLGPLEFARAHLCKARDEGESPFDVDAMKRARELAQDLDLVYSLKGFDLPPRCWVFHGVDLAVTKKKKSHLTAIVTVLLWEDLSRQVLWVESGRWSSREIRDHILDHEKRYGGTFIVENNAAQRWIFDIIMNQDDLPPEERQLPTLVPFTTGKNKAHPQYGVEGLAVEISANKWLIPETGPEKAAQDVEELVGEMLYYTRGAHTGDRLMACWFAREGARKWARGDSDEDDDRFKEDATNPNQVEDKIPGGGVRVYDSEDLTKMEDLSTPLADAFNVDDTPRERSRPETF